MGQITWRQLSKMLCSQLPSEWVLGEVAYDDDEPPDELFLDGLEFEDPHARMRTPDRLDVFEGDPWLGFEDELVDAPFPIPPTAPNAREVTPTGLDSIFRLLLRKFDGASRQLGRGATSSALAGGPRLCP